MKRHFRTAAVVMLGLFLATSAHGGRGGGYRGAAVGPRGGVARSGGYGVSGGGARYGARYGSAHGPYGGAAAGGARGGSYTTARGTTVTHGARGGAYVGPGGRVAAGGARATRVTTPSGRTVTTGSRGGVAAGPGGAVAGRSRAGAAVGPRGGVVAGGSRTVAGARGFATDAGLARYTVRGAAVGGAYSTRYVSRAALTTQAGYVRRGWVHTSCFTPAWYRSYPVAWRAARWVGAGVWAAPAYASLASWCSLPPTPTYYDYGSTVVYRDDEVYVNGDPTASAERYAAQAASLAEVGREAEPPKTDEWQPLGVFAIVQGDEKTSNQVFQLAVNKARVIRGNYYDALGDSVLPVTGKVGPKTQRAAWTIGNRKDTVYEAGIANLTRKETPMLVHFGKDRTQQWTLVRLEEPTDGQEGKR
jgi:hypothetical protein